MIDALRGTKVEDNVRHLHECEAFALKLFAHLATILRLSEAPSGTNPAAAYGFVDHSSAMVVTRAALEAYALCAYLFVPDADRNEEELRRAIWSRSRRMGIQSRRSEPRSKQTRRLRLGNQNKGNVYLRQTRTTEKGFVAIGEDVGFHPLFYGAGLFSALLLFSLWEPEHLADAQRDRIRYHGSK